MRALITMRSAFAALVVAALAAPVAAEPCKVTLVRAPADVRDEIEAALAAEPCSIALEVRIIATSDGLYLLAKAPDGRVHERTVPDAASASLLIASWAADDGLGPAPYRAPNALTAPPAAPPARPDPFAQMGPTLHAAPSDVASAPPLRAKSRPRWMSFGVGTGSHVTGTRATLDFFNRRGLLLGISAGISSAKTSVEGYPYITVGIDEMYMPYFDSIDTRALAYAGYELAWGDWHLRATLGAGLVYTAASADVGPSSTSSSQVHVTMSDFTPAMEAALLVALDLGDGWGLEVGPVGAFYRETLQIDGGGEVGRSAADVQLVAAIRHTL